MLGLQAVPALGQNAVELGLERDINRYRWIARIGASYDVQAWDITIRNYFSSDAYAIFADNFVFRDENRLNWSASRPVSSILDVEVRGNADWFSLSRVFIQNTLTGVTIRPSDHLTVTPSVGFALDQRPGVATTTGPSPLRADSGPAFGMRSTYFETNDDNTFSLRVAADGLLQQLQSRRGHAARLSGTGRRQLEQSTFSSSFVASSFRRDTYQAVSFLNRDSGSLFSESIEQTTSDTLKLVVDATIPLGRGFSFNGGGDLTANSRSVRNTGDPDETLFFDTKFERRSFDFLSMLSYQSAHSRYELSASGGVEEENRSLTNRDELPEIQASQKSNLLRQADFDRGYFSLMGSVRSDLGRRYVATLTGTARILNHNTPETNPDDRDEVFFSARSGLLIRFSPELTTDLMVFGTRYETVYLKSERSAENNVQRSLRFGPGVNWKPSEKTSLRLSSEVRATYTVDQFVLAGRRPRDQSAREMRYDFEGRHDLFRNFSIITSASYSTLHLGRFIEESFAEIPFDTLRINKVWIKVQSGGRYVADIGIRAFVRSDYNQNTSVTYGVVDAQGNPSVDPEGNVISATITRPGRNIIRQMGPTSSMLWPLNKRSSLRLDGWLIFQRVYQRLYGELPDASAKSIEAAARRGRLTVIPNMSMTIRWII